MKNDTDHNNDSSASTTGAWKFVPAGVWVPVIKIASVGTVTLQWSKDGTTNFGNLKDSAGNDYSFTATAAVRYGQILPDGYVRASTTGVSGGAVSVWLEPHSVIGGKSGFEG